MSCTLPIELGTRYDENDRQGHALGVSYLQHSGTFKVSVDMSLGVRVELIMPEGRRGALFFGSMSP